MDILEKVVELKRSNKSFVLVTIVKVTGSTPGKTGFKMVVDKEGKPFGTVGGGAIESEAVNEAQRLVSSNSGNVLKEYILNNDEQIEAADAQVVPMSCKGKVWIYYEVEKNAPVIYIFGSGHVGQALIDFLSVMDFEVVVIDNREEITEKIKAKPVKTILSEYKEYVKNFNPEDDAYFVILTHGHVFDYEILRMLYERKLVKNYVGVIGSKSKAAEMKENLKKEFGSDIDLSKLHSPIGLKIGGNTAPEIALSIISEIQTIKYGKTVTIDGK